MVLTKQEFKARWEKNDCDITFNDIADCAKDWGLYGTPRIHPLYDVLTAVLKEAGVNDE